MGDSSNSLKGLDLRLKEKKIYGVVVCVGYGDILALTLPYLATQLDSLVVVTSSADFMTKRVCEFNYVLCLETDSFYDDGANFNKANGINLGLSHLTELAENNGVNEDELWFLHLDADILVPPRSLHIVRTKPLNPFAIYGVDRVMLYNGENGTGIIDFLANPRSPYPFNGLGGAGNITPFYKDAHIGARILRLAGNEPLETFGYIPIGFWQLWQPSYSGVYDYPANHGEADRTDCLHALKFRSRELIPEITVIHLDTQVSSTQAVMGVNWSGRVTDLITSITRG